ncbi:MAG: hypothetical protein ABI348_05435, partial [Nitrososphaera sp.]
FAKVDKLDNVLFGREVNKCLDALSKDDPETAKSLLLEIAEILRLRGVISPLIDGADRESFRTLADGIAEYSTALEGYQKYDDITKKKIIHDIKRDVGTIKEYIDSLETESHIIKSEPAELNEVLYIHSKSNWVQGSWSSSDGDKYSKIETVIAE